MVSVKLGKISFSFKIIYDFCSDYWTWKLTDDKKEQNTVARELQIKNNDQLKGGFFAPVDNTIILIDVSGRKIRGSCLSKWSCNDYSLVR